MAWSIFETGLTLDEAKTCFSDLTFYKPIELVEQLVQPSLFVPNRGRRHIYLFSAFDILEALVLQYLQQSRSNTPSASLLAKEVCEIICISLDALAEHSDSKVYWIDRFSEILLTNVSIYLLEEISPNQVRSDQDIAPLVWLAIRQFWYILEWFEKYFESCGSSLGKEANLTNDSCSPTH